MNPLIIDTVTNIALAIVFFMAGSMYEMRQNIKKKLEKLESLK